jgi:hypothetical protein
MVEVAPEQVGGTLNGVPYAKREACGGDVASWDCFCPECCRALGTERVIRIRDKPWPNYPSMLRDV